MPDSKPQKIVYLFGAGATHAEMEKMYESLVADTEKDRVGLLMGNVSRRVFKQVQSEEIFKDILDIITTPDGADNIELFISLLEKNNTGGNIQRAAEKVDRLRELVEKDIEGILFRQLRLRFLLHKALLELHHKTSFKTSEKLIGILSLNYDVVLDEAHLDVYGHDPDYAFSLLGKKTIKGKQMPLLKLHGSLGWDNVSFLNKKYRKIPIMPLGIDKDYLQWPYNYIWGRAFELLVDCDVLRIVGCSLSPNDTKLVDLLFKSHLARQKPFIIEIINRQTTGKMFKSNYNFLPKIRLPEDIETNLGLGGISKNEDSPFRGWLKAVGSKLPQKELEGTTYLKDI